MAGDGFTVNTFCLFGEKFDERRTITDLAFCLGQGFTLFSGKNRRQIIGVRHHQIVPTTQNICAFFARHGRPFFLRFACGCDGRRGLGAGKICNVCNDIAARGVGHSKGLTAVAVHPFPRQIALGRQKCWVLK